MKRGDAPSSWLETLREGMLPQARVCREMQAGRQAENTWVLCTVSLGCWGQQRPSGWVAATFQLKSPFAFFGLALAMGSRGF